MGALGWGEHAAFAAGIARSDRESPASKMRHALASK